MFQLILSPIIDTVTYTLASEERRNASDSIVLIGLSDSVLEGDNKLYE